MRIARVVVQVGSAEDVAVAEEFPLAFDRSNPDREALEEAVRIAWEAEEPVRLSVQNDRGVWFAAFDSEGSDNLGADRIEQVRAELFDLLMHED